MIDINEIIEIFNNYITEENCNLTITGETDILSDLSLDSLDIMQLLDDLESKYDISFLDLDDFYDRYRTVNGLKGAIEELININTNLVGRKTKNEY